MLASALHDSEKSQNIDYISEYFPVGENSGPA